MKAKPELWLWAPRGFCAKEDPKGVAAAAAPAAPICPLPKLKLTGAAPGPAVPAAAAAPMPKALTAPGAWLAAPKLKGVGAELPNTGPPALLLLLVV